MTANLLSGSAIGSANLTGSNSVAEINGFSVTGSSSSLALNDQGNLLIAGTVSAARIAVLDPSSQISLGDGATIMTGGTTRPSGPIQSALEPINSGVPGAYFKAASFTQIGSSNVVGQGGGPATLQIDVTGHAQFDPPLGLQATGAWLILDLASGTATGNVFVNALDVIYTTPGSANLSGTIQGVTGGNAAELAFIQPAINVNYQFNGCEIAAAVCQAPTTSQPGGQPNQPVGTPTETLPPVPGTPLATALPNNTLTSTLGGIYQYFLSGAPPALIGSSRLVLVALPTLPGSLRRMTDSDVVPPNISYLDY